MTLFISQRGLDLIKDFEGFSKKPYFCSANKLTIGYGHVITPEEHDKFPPQISEKEGEDLLRKDAAIAEKAVNNLVRVPLEQYEFDALVSLVFNIGATNFSKSTLLRLLNLNTPKKEIAQQFLKWRFANKVPLKGLARRRQAEAMMFLGTASSELPKDLLV